MEGGREREREMPGGTLELEQSLHEAAVEGDLPSFNQTLDKDRKILRRLKVGCLIHTPLHVASFAGHLNIVNKILEENKALAGVVDPRGWSPLHLAAAGGHDQIVEALIPFNPEMCTVLDRDGRDPLHLAAMKGHVKVLTALLRASPYGDHEFLSAKDGAGNTILHLAVKYKKFKIVEYLLGKIEEEKDALKAKNSVNAMNNCGYTAFDILLEIKKDNVPNFDNIEPLFLKVGALRAKDLTQDEWLSKKQDALMVVASLIATMAFQAGINPPGGFWQDNTDTHRAGEAVMAYNYPNTFPFYLRSNTVGFVASVSTILLLITGWPFKKKFFMWILVVIMWVTITSIAFTYAFSITVITPKWARGPLSNTIMVGVITWCSVMALLLLVHTLRLINRWLKINKNIHMSKWIKDYYFKCFRAAANSAQGRREQTNGNTNADTAGKHVVVECVTINHPAS